MSGGITAASVADFLGQGMLDVIVDLFKSDPALYGLLGELLASPEIGVRLGASALVEELAAVDPERRPLAAAALSPLLAHADPVRRGDAAYLLGFVGGAAQREALVALAAADPNADVREVAAEAAEKLRGGGVAAGGRAMLCPAGGEERSSSARRTRSASRSGRSGESPSA